MSEIAELLERFRRGPELVAHAITGAAGSELDFAPEGKWSIRTLVAHLSDAECVGVMRFRQMVAEDDPTMPGWDEKAWSTKLDYARRKPSQSLETLRRVRAENWELLKELPEAAFARTGNHTTRGKFTLLQMLQMFVEHVENHARQIRDVRAAFKAEKAKAAQ